MLFIESVNDEKAPIMIVGNKIDLVDKRIITEDQAFELADKNWWMYGETTYENIKGIQENFDLFIRQLYSDIIYTRSFHNKKRPQSVMLRSQNHTDDLKVKIKKLYDNWKW